MTRGKIIRSLGGFYTIDSDLGCLEARAKGNFRHFGYKPLVGDWVTISFDHKEGVDNLAYIESIEERKNTLIRPPVSNIDQVLLCIPVQDPKYNLPLIDSLLVHYALEGLPVLILISKADLNPQEAEKLKEIYSKAHYSCYLMNLKEEESKEKLLPLLEGKTTALAGVSGAGKSTLTSLCINQNLKTGGVSEKTKRGKHTTRHVELYPGQGFYLLDTPGFSRLDIESIQAEDLALYFPEMKEGLGNCKFLDCNHINEPGCAIKEKLAQGEIPQSRYENYCNLFKELKEKEKNKWR
ncbi:hypothetical protein HMPREF1633_10730 [Tissierellia bacterium S5-A11]|nr:hypothetical protein HMPREF1633_10730 [Tissierellia bacterium S5-A11]